MDTKDQKDCKLIIKNTRDEFISNFKYKYIKCELIIQ